MRDLPSRLTERITIERRSDQTDSVGGLTTTWSKVATVWARIRPQSGRELMAAGALTPVLTHQVEIRYRPEFADPRTAATFRIVYGTRIFSVVSVINVSQRNDTIEMLATEGESNG
jgi:SPP1 family predicted phage head-tail adaptor